jgi:hypothetical protein
MEPLAAPQLGLPNNGGRCVPRNSRLVALAPDVRAHPRRCRMGRRVLRQAPQEFGLNLRHRVGMAACLIVASVAVIVLAGCGGKSDEQATGVGDEFATKALAVCQAALEDKQAWQAFPVSNFDPSDPDASKFLEVSTWLTQQVAPTFQNWLNDLQALGTPPTAQQDWKATLDAVEKINKLNGDQITAANNGDAVAFKAATNALNSTQDELVAASEKAGVSGCADVHAA